jgi:transposase
LGATSLCKSHVDEISRYAKVTQQALKAGKLVQQLGAGLFDHVEVRFGNGPQIRDRLGRVAQRASVKVVAMDMWPAYMSATKQCMPQADIVHDKFYIAKHLGKAVDSVRK